MPYQTIIFCAFSILFSFSALAAECEDNASVWPQVRDCLQEKNISKVDATYNKLMTRLTKKDIKAAKLLKSAQKSWELFAEDSCNYYSEANYVEGLQNDVKLNCWTDFGNARIKVLNAYAKKLDKIGDKKLTELNYSDN